MPNMKADEYKDSSEGPRLQKKPDSVFKWWDSQIDYSSLRQMAFDFLSIPAMSTECERVFSDTKHIVPILAAASAQLSSRL
jgi:hAT family C-terminal dimerisation region